MYIIKALTGGFIHPEKEQELSKLEEKIGCLKGYGGVVKIWHFPIPKESSDFKTFRALIQNNERTLKDIL